MAVLELLGLPPHTRALIISCDNLGSSHAANVGVFESLREGAATTAGLMVPGPWAREAAARFRGDDVGVRLTLTAQYEFMRWGPITHAPSLLGGEGGFPKSVVDLWEHADLEELRRECRAQIERAIYWGFDVTHLDSHMDALSLRPEFFDVIVDMAVEFNLPLRLDDVGRQKTVGFPFRDLAAESGLLSPDRVIIINDPFDVESFTARIASLPSGVTEIAMRPALDSPELRALTDHWTTGVSHLNTLVHQSTRTAIQDAGVTLIGYRELQQAQRQN